MTTTVYYLTGMGGRLHSGLGQALASRGLEVIGRELVGEFRSLDFQDQIDAVASDLQQQCWSANARVIANSFAEWAERAAIPKPLDCEIHVGEHDWQSNPANVCELGEKLGIPVSVVPDAGHMLPQAYVATVIDQWLAELD